MSRPKPYARLWLSWQLNRESCNGMFRVPNARVKSSACSASVQTFSSWQVLLVDLRCHGESAVHKLQHHAPISQQQHQRRHGVESAAADVLGLLSQLKLFPEILIGHSFGGKVVMSMADQFGRIGPRMPRPVQVREHLVCAFSCQQEKLT